ncbi:hypothetical protein [Alterisphingorhabdus coralli]|uniref:Uncharacterized protein n=1 Tax=Alterisphingorhabdus coralli TaxID=3071408 RepID=A0AA97F948_9SPHN|nr:hypothetical protein [Parasphingorhabdus sp. SCSIO 66989]WOE75547.1 hypothetical protein RB602_02200 [Parasphingorhabdus sp. SCSIO 66989]
MYRIHQTVSVGTTTHFGYDGLDLTGEYAQSNSLLRRLGIEMVARIIS